MSYEEEFWVEGPGPTIQEEFDEIGAGDALTHEQYRNCLQWHVEHPEASSEVVIQQALWIENSELVMDYTMFTAGESIHNLLAELDSQE